MSKCPPNIWQLGKFDQDLISPFQVQIKECLVSTSRKHTTVVKFEGRAWKIRKIVVVNMRFQTTYLVIKPSSTFVWHSTEWCILVEEVLCFKAEDVSSPVRRALR